MLNKIKYITASFIILLMTSISVQAENNTPYIYVLGVTQDAGFPQTGCYLEHCMPGWEDVRLRRGAVSLGLIDPSSKSKYMFEASPNFPEQLYQLEKEAPSADYSLDGIFLTHAHIGHYAGLMFLGHEAMGASNVPVYVMPRMQGYLEQNGPWSQLVKYKNILLKGMKNEEHVELGTIKITPFLVPHRDEFSETVGFHIKGPNKSAIFIPDINKWSEWKQSIADLVKTVDYALIDAAFYSDGELPGRDMSKIPHPFVTESIEALSTLDKQERSKVWFIHMNHTNPLLNKDSKESKIVRQKGFNIATEGSKLFL